MKSKELKKAKRDEVKKWVIEEIVLIQTEYDCSIEVNKKVLENFKNILEKLNDISKVKLTNQTKLWLKERIKFISINASEYDERAMKILDYFKYIQSL